MRKLKLSGRSLNKKLRTWFYKKDLIPVSTASANEGLSLSDPTNPEEDDSEIPPLEYIYQNSTDGIFTTSSYDDEGVVADFTNLDTVVNVSPISHIQGFISHPTTLNLGDPTQQEMLQFKIQKVWVLVDLPYGKKAIGTKWVYRNKKDERGVVVRNKARLVAQGHRQEEGIELDENGYRRGTIDKTLFLKKDKHDIILVQVYVDDIIFGSTKKSWCDEFEALMKSRFQTSSIGELTFFLGLQVKQKADGIFISQDKYVAEILKKFDFANVKTTSTPIETQKPLVKDEEASDVDVHIYRSMIGSLMYLTASRPEYEIWQSACSRFQVISESPSHLMLSREFLQILTGNPQQEDVNFLQDSFLGMQKAEPCRLLLLQKQNMLLLQATVGRHHFIRDAYEKKLIRVLKIHTDDNVADLLTKAFDVSRGLIVFRESLRRVTDGTEALLIPTLFILWLDKVSTDSAKLVPLGKVCTAIETLKKNTAKGKVTPLFATMLVQTTQAEGASSERPSEAQPTPSPAPTSEVPNEPHTDSSPTHTSEVPLEQQTDPSPRPSPIPIIPDSIPETSGGNLGGHSSSDKSLSGNEGEMTLQSVYDLCLSLCAQSMAENVSLKQRLTRKSFPKKQRVHKESVSKQGRKFAKGESSVQRDPLFDELPEDTVDHMETENAQDEGRTRDIVDEDKEIEENVLSTGNVTYTDRQIEGTDEQNEGTEEHIEGIEKQIESTDGQRKGTEDHTEGSATQATQTPTSTIFGDDETIAKVLLNMSQAKAVSREKEKGVELKDIEEADRPRPTSTRSLLTLKPLPKIDPKDKGKKKIEEEDESKSESDGIPEAKKKFKQLESDEEMARKIQEEWEGEEERNRIAEEKAANEAFIRNFDEYTRSNNSFDPLVRSTRSINSFDQLVRSNRSILSIDPLVRSTRSINSFDPLVRSLKFSARSIL
ncbi:retrovirus-related pol polyprotein from transposon TNT 1-94 [Tanacetum coccineum]